MIKQTVQAERRLIKSPGAKNGGATMRSITVAATLILLLTAHANSQNLNMLGGTSRPVTQEEVAKKKAAEEAYKAAVGKIPDKKSADDPWGTVRDTAPSKNGPGQGTIRTLPPPDSSFDKGVPRDLPLFLVQPDQ
jgi:hypothetical protein